MTQALEIHTHDDEPEGLNWSRITGITMALAVHVGALLLLLAPMVPPPAESAEEEVTIVNLVRPPPPPPPPPPPEEPPPPQPIRQLSPPTPTPIQPPPPEQPPIEVEDPSPIDLPPTPPSPPSPPRPSETIAGSIDPSSQRMNPPDYPSAAVRAGITGTVILLVDIDAQGTVLNVRIEKSSRNRDLDRAAMDAPKRKKWRFSPAKENGQAVASTVRVPVVFNL